MLCVNCKGALGELAPASGKTKGRIVSLRVMLRYAEKMAAVCESEAEGNPAKLAKAALLRENASTLKWAIKELESIYGHVELPERLK